MKKKHEESHENHERWLLTYADLITLLMIFFVVMFAMSNIDAKKWSSVAQSLAISLGGGGKQLIGTDYPSNVNEKPSIEEVENQAKQLQQLRKDIDKYIKDKNLSNEVETQITERGLMIRIKESTLFDSGSADIHIKFFKTLSVIGSYLKKVDAYIRIEGNTDNVPIHNSNFKSNWHLAAARATNVAEFLIKNSKLNPNNITVVSFGEYRPIANNSTESGRSKNRRVDIIIVDSKYSGLETIKK